MGPDGQPVWTRPKGLKTKYDFPKARRGGPDRFEFDVGSVKPGSPKRLDKFLLSRFRGYSRSFLQKLIKDGRVLVDGAAVKSSRHIATGERITVLLPEAAKHEAEEIPFEVLHEDEHLIALVKPAGVVVHPARGNKDGTLYNGLLHYFRAQLEEDPSFHLGTVHRLDEQTSGVMVYALDKKAHKDLTRQFENRLLRKTYLCLVAGAPAWETREIDAPLGVDPRDKHVMAVNGLDAREAQTGFVRVSRSPCGRFALLRAHPRTGRSHQIRVHAKELGYPILGDVAYGGPGEHEAFGELRPRVCLHAETLELAHPIHGQPMRLHAPPPEDLRAMMDVLGLALQ
ncbi:MAG: RluA family pseudouridine synthase [Planctomycetota bacterium]|nr:RluA family pseudouridine synthase [Planctomycetota bacterium]